MPDWVFTTLGWTLAAVALALSFGALFGDRARGRKRCPRCWYDLAGQLAQQPEPPWTCPECGRSVMHARSLAKTRRRWWSVPLAIVLFIVAWFTAYSPEIYRRGWWAAAPRPVLLAWMLTEPNVLDKSSAQARGASRWYREIQRAYRPSTRAWWPGEAWLAARVVNGCVAMDGPDAQMLRELAAEALARLRHGDPSTVNDVDPYARGLVLLTLVSQTYREAQTYIEDSVIVEHGSSTVTASRTLMRQAGHAVRHDTAVHDASPDRATSSIQVWGMGEKFAISFGGRETRYNSDRSNALLMDGTAAGPAGLFIGGFSLRGIAPQLTIPTEVEFDGHRCWWMRTHANTDAWMIIDSESLVIRQLMSPQGRLSTFRPVLDAPVTEDCFPLDLDTAPPNLIGDGQELIAQLKPLAESAGAQYAAVFKAVADKESKSYVFDEVRTRRLWPAGTPISLEPWLHTPWRYPEHWMIDLRWRTREGLASGEATIGGGEPWPGITTPLHGDVTLDLDLTIFRVNDYGQEAAARAAGPIGTEHTSVTFRVTDDDLEVIKPVRSARLDWMLAQLLSIDVKGVPLVDHSSIYSLADHGFDGVAFGLIVELLHNGRVVADSRQGWIIGDQLSTTNTPNGATITKDASMLYIDEHKDEPGWTARIRSDRNEQLRILKGEHYWQGQLEVPFTFVPLQSRSRGVSIKPLPPGGPPMDWPAPAAPKP